jgi:type VI secretion system secreted protein Hcp
MINVSGDSSNNLVWIGGGKLMAVNAYLTIKGTKQGGFKGSTRAKGVHAGKSILLAACYGNFITPTTSITGCPAGKRRHQPLTIRKEVDAASPMFFLALVGKETMNGKIELVNADRGSQAPSQIIELSGGLVSSINRVPPATKGQTHSEGRDKFEQEELKFTFQTIDVTWNDGGITMHDDWDAPA